VPDFDPPWTFSRARVHWVHLWKTLIVGQVQPERLPTALSGVPCRDGALQLPCENNEIAA
jgi:hypothetical protein